MNWLNRLLGWPHTYKCGLCGLDISPKETIVTDHKTGERTRTVATVKVLFQSKKDKWFTCPGCFYIQCEVARALKGTIQQEERVN